MSYDDEQLALRRRVGVALVVVGQMLPEGAIKGGSAMALRYGRGTHTKWASRARRRDEKRDVDEQLDLPTGESADVQITRMLVQGMPTPPSP